MHSSMRHCLKTIRRMLFAGDFKHCRRSAIAGFDHRVYRIRDAYAIDETPTEIIAAQIRDQGYECVKPQSAKRDVAQSAPNETVWVLDCENGSYRVTLVPDLAAKVELLKKN